MSFCTHIPTREDCSFGLANNQLNAAHDNTLVAPPASSQPSHTPDVPETAAIPLELPPDLPPTISDSQSLAPESKALKTKVLASNLPSTANFPCPESGCDGDFATSHQLGKRVRALRGNFSCSKEGCRFTAQTASTLKRHVVQVHGGRRFECPEIDCCAAFGQAYNLYTHIKAFHKQYMFKCPQQTCGETFKQPAKLKKHVLSSHQHAFPSFTVYQALSNSPNPVKLPGNIKENCTLATAPKVPQLHACTEESCGAEFTRKDQLYRHLRVQHTQKERVTTPRSTAAASLAVTSPKTSTPDLNEIPPAYETAVVTCPTAGCGSNFNKVYQMAKHGHYSCSELGCSFVSSKYRKLAEHIAVAHENQRFNCPEENCKANYTTKSNLIAHIRVNHRQHSKLVCPHQDCGTTFKWKQSLKLHVKVQHASEEVKQNQRRHACPYQDCGWSFELRKSLEKHVKAKHGLDVLQEPAQDQIITSTFSQSKTVAGSLVKTQEDQTDSHPPQLQTACLEEECDKLLSKEDELKSHLPETFRGPFHCCVPDCTFGSTDIKQIVKHWNNKHTDDPSKAVFTDQATGVTLDLYATCCLIMQCKVCMKVRTSGDTMDRLIFKMRSHIAAAHPEELEATNGCSEPLYRILKGYTGRNEH